MCSSHATQHSDPSQGLLVGHRWDLNEDRASVTDVKPSGKRRLNFSSARTQSIWSQAGGLCYNKNCGKKVLFLFKFLSKGNPFVWDGKLQWVTVDGLGRSRNSHHCVGKQAWYVYSSACVRVRTCVLWPLNIIRLRLKGKKHIKIFIFYETEAFWESPLSLLACSSVLSKH